MPKKTAAKKPSFPTQDEIREKITNTIVASLEKGQIPWRKPWSLDPNCGIPANIANKKHYSGVNPLILEIAAMEKQYRSQWWGTFKQWQELGGSVRKGEKSTSIVFWKILHVEDKTKKDKKGKAKINKIFLLRFYNVFNLQQVEDKEGKLAKYMPAPLVPQEQMPHPDFAEAEKIVVGTKAKIIYGGNRACYIRPIGSAWPKHSAGDEIHMPNRNQFPDQRDFYDTEFHELIHWTEIRRKWTGSYEMGELIAEIGSCFVSRVAMIPQSDDLKNHAAYVQSWLKAMKSDPKWIFRASREASKAADFILQFSREVPGWKPGDELSVAGGVHDTPDKNEVDQAA